jgi:predicted PurR-regulated permease PerM
MSSEDKTIININNKNNFFYLFLVLFSLGIIYFLHRQIIDIAIVILFSIIIASSVDPGARWFQRRKIPRILAVIFVYFIALIVVGFIFYLIIPTLFSEISRISSTLSLYTQTSVDEGIIAELLPGLPKSLANMLQQITMASENYINDVLINFSNIASKVFGGVLSMVLIVVFSFYLSVQERGIENFLSIVTPIGKEEYVLNLWARSSNKIGKWLQGQILLGLLVGVLVFLGLMILGVPYALVFALMAAIFELIPIVGPILSAVPPFIVAVVQSPTLGLLVLGLYFLIQQFENHLIYPLVVRKIIGIPPIMTIIALFVGGKIGGLLGILLSIPVAVVLLEIFNDIEKNKKKI